MTKDMTNSEIETEVDKIDGEMDTLLHEYEMLEWQITKLQERRNSLCRELENRNLS